jgi:hypothetical protein
MPFLFPTFNARITMRTLLILSVVVLGFASFLKRKLCAFPRHDDDALKPSETENETTLP